MKSMMLTKENENLEIQEISGTKIYKIIFGQFQVTLKI